MDENPEKKEKLKIVFSVSIISLIILVLIIAVIKKAPRLEIIKAPKPEINVRRIVNLIEVQQNDIAIEIINEHISKRPNNGLLYFLRARAYVGLERIEDSLADISKVLELGFPRTQGYVLKAMIYGRKLGKWKEQAEFATKALEFDPTETDAYYLRAEAKIKMSDYSGALKDYQSLVALEPANPQFRLEMADVRREIKDYNGAIEDVNRVLKSGPDKSKGMAYHKLGKIYSDMKLHEEALENYFLACKHDPTRAQYYIDRAGAYEQVGDYIKASKDYEVALTARNISSGATYYFLLAKNLFRVGMSSKALSAVDTAIKKSDTIEDYFDLRGRIKAEIGDYKGALEDFNRMVLINPQKKRTKENYLKKMKRINPGSYKF